MLLCHPVISYTRAGVFVFVGCLIVWLVTACSNQYAYSENGALSVVLMSESNQGMSAVY